MTVTVRCALTADGLPTPGAARHCRAALLRTRADKERTCTAGAQRQVPVGCGCFGNWGPLE